MVFHRSILRFHGELAGESPPRPRALYGHGRSGLRDCSSPTGHRSEKLRSLRTVVLSQHREGKGQNMKNHNTPTLGIQVPSQKVIGDTVM